MPRPFKKIIFRAAMRGTPALPLAVRSVGHCLAGRGYVEDVRPRQLVSLIWVISGRGRVLFDGSLRDLRGPQVCLIPSLAPHRVLAVGDGFHFRWCTMVGGAVTVLVRTLALPRRPFHAGPCPEGDFDALGKFVQTVGPTGARQASVLAYRMLMELPARCTAGGAGGMVPDVVALIDRHLDDPQLNVDWLAGQLGRNRSAFSRRFARDHGVSPVRYIKSARIQRAIDLLLGTSLPVAAIARRCGYSDPAYFSRDFSRALGESPVRFRVNRDRYA